MRSRDFYAVFQSAAEWQVTSGGRALGRVAPSPDLDPGACLVLAGKLWQVQQVFAAEKEVTVIPATAARHVLYSGGGIPDLHPRMAQHARAILERDDTPGYLSPAGQAALAEARAEYRRQGLHERDTVTHGQPWVVFPWTGTRAARTLLYRFRRIGLEADFPGRLAPWVITIEPDGGRALVDRLRELLSDATTPEKIVAGIPDELLRTHKHDEHVPEALLRARAATKWLDWDEAQRVLRRLAGLATPRTA